MYTLDNYYTVGLASRLCSNNCCITYTIACFGGGAISGDSPPFLHPCTCTCVHAVTSSGAAASEELLILTSSCSRRAAPRETTCGRR